MPGGPADKAGLVGGDVITSFDGHQVRQANEMMNLLVNRRSESKLRSLSAGWNLSYYSARDRFT